MKKQNQGTGTRYDRFTANEINREKDKPVATFYDTRYNNKKCTRCGERKSAKGGRQLRGSNNTRIFICAECCEVQ